jgi:hypothetical protein
MSICCPSPTITLKEIVDRETATVPNPPWIPINTFRYKNSDGTYTSWMHVTIGDDGEDDLDYMDGPPPDEERQYELEMRTLSGEVLVGKHVRSVNKLNCNLKGTIVDIQVKDLPNDHQELCLTDTNGAKFTIEAKSFYVVADMKCEPDNRIWQIDIVCVPESAATPS